MDELTGIPRRGFTRALIDAFGKGKDSNAPILNDGVNKVGKPNFKPLNYFAAYGSSRLEIQSDQTASEITGKSTKTYSMFNSDGVSLNIGQKLVLWYLNDDSRYKVVKEILLKLLPHGADITVDRKKMEVLYIEKEKNGNEDSTFEPISFQKLAAGNKSIIAMIGDLLIRFYKEYEKDGKTGIHPGDFEGIMIIDELDLHLHPKWLRKAKGQVKYFSSRKKGKEEKVVLVFLLCYNYRVEQ